MMMPLMTVKKCPKCSETNWITDIEIVSNLEEISPEEMKKFTSEVLSKKRVTSKRSKRVEKVLVKEFKRLEELQHRVKYVCGSCGYILGKITYRGRKKEEYYFPRGIVESTCLQCNEVVFQNLETYHVFEGANGVIYLIHSGECIKQFRPDVYDLFESKN